MLQSLVLLAIFAPNFFTWMVICMFLWAAVEIHNDRKRKE